MYSCGRILGNVPVFDTGGRGATTTSVERGIGDVLVTFEAEVTAIRREYQKIELAVVMPSMSVRADFAVAVVDKNVDKRARANWRGAYLQFLFTPQGQDLIARHYNRVYDASVAQKYAKQFPGITWYRSSNVRWLGARHSRAFQGWRTARSGARGCARTLNVAGCIARRECDERCECDYSSRAVISAS